MLGISNSRRENTGVDGRTKLQSVLEKVDKTAGLEKELSVLKIKKKLLLFVLKLYCTTQKSPDLVYTMVGDITCVSEYPLVPALQPRTAVPIGQ